MSPEEPAQIWELLSWTGITILSYSKDYSAYGLRAPLMLIFGPGGSGVNFRNRRSFLNG